MRIALTKNVEINDQITLAKGTEGTLKGVTWNSEGEKCHVEFEQGTFLITDKDFTYVHNIPAKSV